MCKIPELSRLFQPEEKSYIIRRATKLNFSDTSPITIARDQEEEEGVVYFK